MQCAAVRAAALCGLGSAACKVQMCCEWRFWVGRRCLVLVLVWLNVKVNKVKNGQGSEGVRGASSDSLHSLSLPFPVSQHKRFHDRPRG